MSFSSQKGEFDRFFNRLDRPVEESRPDRQPDRPVDPTGASRPDRFPSLLCSWSLAFRSSIPVLGLERVVSSEGLSLASFFFCVLGLEPCVFDSTSANKILIFYLGTVNKKLQKIKKSISLDNTLFRTKKKRGTVLSDFRKNVGL